MSEIAQWIEGPAQARISIAAPKSGAIIIPIAIAVSVEIIGLLL